MKNKLRPIICIFLILVSALALTACASPAPETEGEGLSIVATVFPAYDFARQVAGEDAEVTLLVPPGSESHSFEPTPHASAFSGSVRQSFSDMARQMS